MEDSAKLINDTGIDSVLCVLTALILLLPLAVCVDIYICISIKSRPGAGKLYLACVWFYMAQEQNNGFYIFKEWSKYIHMYACTHKE